MDKKAVSDKQITMMFSAMIAFIAICMIKNISLIYAFGGAILFASCIFVYCGYDVVSLMKMMGSGINDCKSIYIIIVLMGVTISIWLASGIVPTIIYYGFLYINNTNYLLACFLLTGLIAIFMGTALGTLSTIGMALYGIGRGLMIPAPILLGAIVSGAFIADKISPISSLTNLTMKLTGIQYRDYLKTALKTLVPTIILSSIVYFFIGENYTSSIDALKLAEYQTNLRGAFTISPVLLLFPLAVIVLAVLGVKILLNMSIGVLGCIGICLTFQKMSIMEVINVLFYGYKPNIPMIELSSILKGGGILPMIEVILIVMSAIALGSLFEGTNVIKPIIDWFMKKIKSNGDLVFRTGVLSAVLTVMTCDQTVGILFPAKFLGEKYDEFGIDKKILARTISDTGIIVAPLMAWNINSIIIAIVTGVTAFQYAPYAVLCYIAPIVTIIAGYSGNIKSVIMQKKTQSV